VLCLVLCAGSNTGCLCAASLAGGEMLMRGHREHDAQLQALLDDPAYTCAMLVSAVRGSPHWACTCSVYECVTKLNALVVLAMWLVCCQRVAACLLVFWGNSGGNYTNTAAASRMHCCMKPANCRAELQGSVAYKGCCAATTHVA
jgi:hypothetical protein